MVTSPKPTKVARHMYIAVSIGDSRILEWDGPHAGSHRDPPAGAKVLTDPQGIPGTQQAHGRAVGAIWSCWIDWSYKTRCVCRCLCMQARIYACMHVCRYVCTPLGSSWCRQVAGIEKGPGHLRTPPPNASSFFACIRRVDAVSGRSTYFDD